MSSAAAATYQIAWTDRIAISRCGSRRGSAKIRKPAGKPPEISPMTPVARASPLSRNSGSEVPRSLER